MTVFVDALEHRGWRLGANCHLLPRRLDAASLAELHEFAASLGMRPQWFQSHPRHPHYDLTASRREAALRLGAVELSTGAWIKLVHRNGFFEPGSGMVMVPGVYYALSDSGSVYSAVGCRDPQRLVEVLLACREYDLSPSDICQPIYSEEFGWGNMGLCNLLLSDHLRHFWLSTEPDIFNEMNQ